MVELVAAQMADAEPLQLMLREYIHELGRYRSDFQGVLETGGALPVYPYLEAYWSERGRYAYFAESSGRRIGFALVRDTRSTGESRTHLAEFYIEPRSRRWGVGRHVATAVWTKHPGEWEVQVLESNSGAVAFWTSCIRATTGNRTEAVRLQAADGPRLRYRFVVDQEQS